MMTVGCYGPILPMTNTDIHPLLQEIHKLHAEGLLNMLKVGGLTPAEMSVVSKFLKDNDITCTIAESEPLAEIKKFPFPAKAVAEV